MTTVDIDLGKYALGWSDTEEDYVFKPQKGLNEEIIREMSRIKKEPEWMLEFRLRAYQRFLRKPVPTWGGGGTLDEIDFDDIYYYVKPMEGQAKDWDMVPDSIKETYEKLGIPEAERKYLAGVTAQYECLRGDARVYTTTRGMVPIKEIVPGDRVFALDDETGELVEAPVKAAAQTDVRQTYKITVGGRFRRTVHATDNHPFLVLEDVRKPGRLRARYERRWKTVAELRVGDLVAVARDLPDFGAPARLIDHGDPSHRLPETTSVDLMWLLGLWLGDGYLRYEPGHGTYRMEIAIPATQPELQAEVARVVDSLFGRRATHPDAFRVNVASKTLVEWLMLNGIDGHALTKRVPDWVFGLPTAQRLAFIGGYLDADGYVQSGAKSAATSVTSGNRVLLEDIAELARLSGLRPSGPWEFASKHPHDASRTVTGFRLGLSGAVSRLDVRHPMKRERIDSAVYRHGDTSARGATFRAHTTGTLGFARVVEIEAADVAPVYDIEVDGPHNFVAEGIVVHNSEVVYHRNREDLEGMGVLFTDMDTALREYPEIVREYFGTIIPPNDNKFAALNSAVWSGGSFIYVPPGVHVDQPLQAYFRINAENMGQFERTLIIVDEGAYCHYVEGCSAPVYSSDSLHSAVVEIVVKEGGRCRYTTIQNWSNNVYNLVTKRAAAYKNATMEWIDGNLGCLAEGSMVTTPSGPKAIEHLTPGEQVLSYDDANGELCWRTVRAKKYSGEQPVREVSIGERRIRVTDNHPFYSYTERDGLGYLRADELTHAIVPKTLVDFDVPQRSMRFLRTEAHPAVDLPELLELTPVTVSDHLGVVPTWDIEVEGTGNFVSEGFIVHNSKLTMKYPAVWMMEEGAHGEVLSIAFAGEGQHQDAGAKMVHVAPNTTSLITSKSISKNGGRGGYRGLVRVEPGATNARSFVRCDALILDEDSRSDTYPYMEIEESNAQIGHEATVSKVGDNQLFYLMSRGLSEEEATAMIVAGFIEPIVKELPMEYAVELNRLIELQMIGSVG